MADRHLERALAETQHKDGSFDVALPEGDKIHFAPDGTRTETHPRGPVAALTIDPNTGHRELTYRGGAREVREPDGSGSIIEKNGKTTALPVKPWPGKVPASLPEARPPEGEPEDSVGPHGEEIATWPDGTRATTTKDGKQTLELPAPNPVSRSAYDPRARKETIELRDGPIAKIERPADGAPGTTTTTYRDGTREVRSPDGRGYFVLPGGKRMTLPIR